MYDGRAIKKNIIICSIFSAAALITAFLATLSTINAAGGLGIMKGSDALIIGLIDGAIAVSVIAAVCTVIFNAVKARRSMAADLKYRSIIDMSGDIVFEFHLSDMDLRMNEKWKQAFGDKELIDRNGRLAERYVHPDDRAAMSEYVEKLCRGAQAESCVVRIMDRHGKYVWVRILAGMMETEGDRSICGTITDVTDETERRRALEERAHKDGLTNLLNVLTGREAINARLENIDDSGLSAFIMFDVDSFKKINDRFGHPFGDEVLKAMADCMRKTFRHGDVMMRLGGDEFIVYAEHIPNKDFINSKCSDFRLIWNAELPSTGDDMTVSCSVGVAYAGEDGYTFDELYAAADERMYSEKHER